MTLLQIVASACLIAVALGAAIPENDKPTNQLIVGGSNVTIEEVPYIVAMYHSNRQVCGGSIVSPRHVVTAAHCCEGVLPQTMSFVAGLTSHGKQKQRVAVKAIHVHPNYDNLDYDVAVVELKTSLEYNKCVQPVALATEEPKNGTLVRVSGWGHVKENGLPSPHLLSVLLPSVDRATCSESYGRFLTITPRMTCAGVEGKDACQGDSGGPLVDAEGKLAGVVSFGNGCGRKGYPGVFSNVADKEITAFIKKHVKV